MQRAMRITGVIVLIAIFGFSGFALADGNGMMGGSSMMGSGTMSGGGFIQGMIDLFQGNPSRMGYNGQSRPYRGRPERQQPRDDFFDSTRRLRTEIHDKQSALEDEMGKQAPDKAKVTRLQNELFRLQSEYDQKLSDYERTVGHNTSSSNGEDSANLSSGHDR